MQTLLYIGIAPQSTWAVFMVCIKKCQHEIGCSSTAICTCALSTSVGVWNVIATLRVLSVLVVRSIVAYLNISTLTLSYSSCIICGITTIPYWFTILPQPHPYVSVRAFYEHSQTPKLTRDSVYSNGAAVST